MQRQPYIPDEKRPRTYAAEILALPKNRQRGALDAVPAKYRQWVRDYLTTWYHLGRHRQTEPAHG